MLDDCAEGYSIRISVHHRRVTYNDKIYPSFPKHDEIELGHVRSLVRHLGIDKDCANGLLPITN